MRPALVLGIDPGVVKSGLAVVGLGDEIPLARRIAATSMLVEEAQKLLHTYSIPLIALGGGTTSQAAEHLLQTLGRPIVIVNERNTTLQARARYFQANPPRGWRRLVPQGILLPGEPIDDWAAVLIAERYFMALSQESGQEA